MILQVGGGVVSLAPWNSVACIVYLMGMLRSIFRPFLWVGDLIEIVKSVEPFLRKPKKVGKTWELRCMFLKKHVFFPWNITQADWRFDLIYLFFFQEWFVNPMRFFLQCGSTRPVKTDMFLSCFRISSVEDDLKKTTGSGLAVLAHILWFGIIPTRSTVTGWQQSWPGLIKTTSSFFEGLWVWVFSVGEWLQEMTKQFGIAEFVWNQVLLTDFGVPGNSAIVTLLGPGEKFRIDPLENGVKFRDLLHEKRGMK